MSVNEIADTKILPELTRDSHLKKIVVAMRSDHTLHYTHTLSCHALGTQLALL